jgi:transcriptional regulator with XRE-family HTH domain
MDTIQRASHKALIRLLIEKRQASGMRQRDVARKLGRTQSWLAKIEGGQRRIDVCELCDLARALKFNPDKMVAKIARIAKQE